MLARVAAMLAADAELEAGPGGPAPLGGQMRSARRRRRRRCETKGSRSKMPCSTYAVRKRPASSRLTPKVVWVRSLVPKLKNSASLGDVAGAQARRGAARSSCRPDSRRFCAAPRTRPAAVRSISARMIVSSARVATSGTMISGIGASPFHRHRERGLEDGARLHLVDFGIGDAEPAAAMAEHRVEFVKLGDPALQRLDADARRRRRPRRTPPRYAAGIRGAADRAGGW